MLKKLMQQWPLLDTIARAVYARIRPPVPFTTSATYWESRYRRGGTSGVGSYAHLAEFKAEILNAFVAEQGIRTVIEFGCGDGNQLSYFRFPFYTGYDVSETAVQACRELCKRDGTKRFALHSEYSQEMADLVLSLDVVYHLTEDKVYETYMQTLFAAAGRYVIIYSNNTDDNSYPGRAAHIKNRHFTTWVETNIPGFRLLRHVPNKYAAPPPGFDPCLIDFYIYERKT